MNAPEGHVALVAGASRGIGHAIARELARLGFRVYAAAEGTEAELAALSAGCHAAGAPEAAFGLFDFLTPGEAERMVAAALARFGRVDVLVNVAALRCQKPFGDFTHADFHALMTVNVGAALFASQAVLPAMRAQGGGRIVHIASQMGQVAAPLNTIYGMTKAALIRLARSMALELSADGILVNTVSPGPVSSELINARYANDPAGRAAMEARVPIGRFGTPEEIAEVVGFLAASKGGFLQGSDLVVDGGYIIH
jgi:NAD(P)-dependent dehydrogenase (short-subunit alcohol dehydrogenase family)